MARRFQAKKSTILKDLIRVMGKLGATSLKISEPNILDEDDTEAKITFDRHGKRYISTCNAWEYFSDNLRAAQLAIDYTWRIMEGYGVTMVENDLDVDLLDRVFGWLEAPLDAGILLLGEGATDWFEVLGVESDASKQAIINAYKALAKVHHPDAGGSSDDFIKLRTAYETGVEAFA